MQLAREQGHDSPPEGFGASSETKGSRTWLTVPVCRVQACSTKTRYDKELVEGSTGTLRPRDGVGNAHAVTDYVVLRLALLIVVLRLVLLRNGIYIYRRRRTWQIFFINMMMDLRRASKTLLGGFLLLTVSVINMLLGVA